MDQFKYIEEIEKIKYDFNLTRKKRDEVIYHISPYELLSMIIDFCDCPETYQIVTPNKKLKFIFPQIKNEHEKNYFQALIQTAVRERLSVKERKDHMKRIINHYNKEN